MSTQRANNVIVNTIPPVMDKPDRQALADSVNNILPDLCSQTGAVLMSHEHNFRHADSSPNDLLLQTLSQTTHIKTRDYTLVD